jgi:ElaB/YqjD/DUF883 family membrane-anchored ribosome-binding protein
MTKIKPVTEKSQLLLAMKLEREKFVATQNQLEQHRLRPRGLSSTEGFLLNGLFSLATAGRFPALLKRPVQAIALSWLNGRFGRLVSSSLAQSKPQTQRALFADIGGAEDGESASSDESLKLTAVDDLRRVSNELNAAIQQGLTAEIEPLSIALKAQIIKTRAVLETVAATSQTPVDRAVARARDIVQAQPWAAVGIAAGTALALWKRWQTKEQLRRDFETFYRQTGRR